MSAQPAPSQHRADPTGSPLGGEPAKAADGAHAGPPGDGLRLRAHISRGPAFALAVDVALPGRGITAIFGPSGCGKTTLLRAVAGLERPAPGCIGINGDLWQDDAQTLWRPTHQRPLGYVFQEASLFAHLSVQDNLRFGQRRVPEAAQRVSLEQAIELLGIGTLLARRPHQLSGGERQRVAIARALATSPQLLLMDEPLASLDAARKTELLPYFERLQRELDIPVLYVSHALDEVARLAAHVLLLDAGRVVAQGPTNAVLTRLDLPLAQSEAASAVVEGTVCAHDAHWRLLQVQFDGGTLQLAVPPNRAADSASEWVGQPVRLRIQARDVSLALSAAADSSILNLLPARVTALQEASGGQVIAQLALGRTQLLAHLTRKSVHNLGLQAGCEVFAQIKSVALIG